MNPSRQWGCWLEVGSAHYQPARQTLGGREGEILALLAKGSIVTGSWGGGRGGEKFSHHAVRTIRTAH